MDDRPRLRIDGLTHKLCNLWESKAKLTEQFVGLVLPARAVEEAHAPTTTTTNNNNDNNNSNTYHNNNN